MNVQHREKEMRHFLVNVCFSYFAMQVSYILPTVYCTILKMHIHTNEKHFSCTTLITHNFMLQKKDQGQGSGSELCVSM